MIKAALEGKGSGKPSLGLRLLLKFAYLYLAQTGPQLPSPIHPNLSFIQCPDTTQWKMKEQSLAAQNPHWGKRERETAAKTLLCARYFHLLCLT